jgi:hypothetical protein
VKYLAIFHSDSCNKYFNSRGIILAMLIVDSPSGCEFRCGDNTCVPLSQVCDLVTDCQDGADVRNCSKSFQNAYYLTPEDLPMECPPVADALGVCVTECNNGHDTCDENEICCENVCGHTCSQGIPTSPLCPNIHDLKGIPEFRPSCEADGNFTDVQCLGDYCWCVDVISGQPVTEGVQSQRPVCHGCQVPNVDMVIRVGESYTTKDGCNTWYGKCTREA